MSRRMPMLLIASWLAMPGIALAEDLTPEQIAAIRRDEKAAQAKVNAAYGNRMPSEMSTDERRQAIQDQQAAGTAVLEKHGVSDKEYSRQVARMGREERAAVERAEKDLEAKEQAKREAQAAAEKKKAADDEEARAPEDIPIQTGFGDNNPVELESSKDAASVVEQGLPPGEQAAEEGGNAEGEVSDVAPVDAPAPPAKKGRR